MPPWVAPSHCAGSFSYDVQRSGGRSDDRELIDRLTRSVVSNIPTFPAVASREALPSQQERTSCPSIRSERTTGLALIDAVLRVWVPGGNAAPSARNVYV